MKTLPSNNDIIKGIVRNERVRQGFFDGRFRTRKITDKKKELNKYLCRKKIY